MNNLYRGSSRRRSAASSRVGAVLRALVFVALASGVFVLLVWWFRGGEEEGMAGEGGEEVLAASDEQDGTVVPNGIPVSFETPVSITLITLPGEAASGTAVRTHRDGVFSITALAQLPAIDGAKTAYEAWFVKPGITDFFSLGELYPREDGAWGLVWETTDALARTDIDEFHRILITREPRNDNPAPSTDQVLEGEFE